MNARPTGLAAVLAMALGACGGQTVIPLDPRDATLPSETRRWVADAEDGVVVARARRDMHIGKLAEVNAWRSRMLDVKWDRAKGANMSDVVSRLAETRVALVEDELELSEMSVEFAMAKKDLANAERAMLHDLHQYDLKPLREDADRIRGEMNKLISRVDKRRGKLVKTTDLWWRSYAMYVKAGGRTTSFWTSDVGLATPAQSE